MDEKQMLKDLGLNSYEANVYMEIIKRGIIDANTLYKESGVPFGRIYEIINHLVAKGLVDVQDSRPKKYRAKPLKTAMKSLIEDKKKKMDEEYENTLKTASILEDRFSKLTYIKPEEKSFWTVAVGEGQVVEMTKESIREAEKEFCQLLDSRYDLNKRAEAGDIIRDEFVSAIKKGIKVYVIAPKSFKGLKRPEKFLAKLSTEEKKKLKIRILDVDFQKFNIIDSKQVIFKIMDPADSMKDMISIKIFDEKVAKILRKKFDEFFSQGEEVKIG